MLHTPLCEIARQYGTDKYGHGYTPFYHLLFGYRREAVRHVLEIGIGTALAMAHVQNYQPGASLRMWEEYFPNADIYGLDNDPSALIASKRIRSRLCDQSQYHALLEAVQGLGVSFDLILDDGSHDPDHQLLGVMCLMRFLHADGVYVIEDVNEPDYISARLPYDHSITTFQKNPQRADQCIVIPRQEPL